MQRCPWCGNDELYMKAENNLPQLALDNAAKVLRDIGLKDAKLSLAPRYQPLPLAQVG